MLGAYLGNFRENFGLTALLVAVAGVVALAMRDSRRAVVLFSYPVAFLLYMSTQRVFFERNAVAVHLFIALAVVLAGFEVPALLARKWGRSLGAANRRERVELGVQGALVVACSLTLPWQAVIGAYRHDIEPRNLAVQAASSRLARGSLLLVDKSLDVDPRTLPAGIEFAAVELPANLELIRSESESSRGAVILAPDQRGATYAAVLEAGAVEARFGGVGPEIPGALRNDREVVVVVARRAMP